MSVNFLELLEQFPTGTKSREQRANARESIALFRRFRRVGTKVLLLTVVLFGVAVLTAAQNITIWRYRLSGSGILSEG